jgi:hypothetical protein
VPQREAKPETRKPGNSTKVSLPGLMAGIRPMPSFRATGSQWFLPCWQQEIAAVDPPSFEPLTLDLHLGLPDFGKPPENSGLFRLGAARLQCNACSQGISLVLRIKKLDLFKYVIT